MVGSWRCGGPWPGVVAQFVGLEDLADHAQAVGLVDVERVPGEHELLGLAGPELPRVAEVLHIAHAEPGAYHGGEGGVLVGTIRSHAHISIRAAAKTVP